MANQTPKEMFKTLVTPRGAAEWAHLVEPDTKWKELGEYKTNLTVSREAALPFIEGLLALKEQGLKFFQADADEEAKAKGRPWEAAKAFDHSAPISYIRPAAKCPAMDKADVWLYINAEKRQNGTTADMIWSVAEVIAEISKYWELAPGDLILTGTPGGVGAVNRGETVNAGVSGAGAVRFKLV